MLKFHNLYNMDMSILIQISELMMSLPHNFSILFVQKTNKYFTFQLCA